MDPTMIGTTSIDALPMASPGQQGQPIQQQMQQQQQPQQAPQQAQYQQENIKLC